MLKPSALIIFVIFFIRVDSSCVYNILNDMDESLRIKHLSNTNRLCFSYEEAPLKYATFCYPSIIVAGFPKCGTSFFFKMLSKNPYLLPTKRKELCLGGPLSESWTKMISFLPHANETDKKMVISGCLHLGANIKAMKQLCAKGIKLIYVVRDVADMLWASYNYWCIQGFDRDCYPGKRTSTSDVRNSLHFHHLMTSSSRLGGGMILSTNGKCFQDDITLSQKVYGKENILILKSEDALTLPGKRTLLLKILYFLGGNGILDDKVIQSMTSSIKNEASSTDISPIVLDFILSLSYWKSRMDIKQWLSDEWGTLYKVNSGETVKNRSEKSITHLNTSQLFQSNIYEVSHFEPMLEDTRRWIYEKWRDECLWLKEKESVLYSQAC